MKNFTRLIFVLCLGFAFFSCKEKIAKPYSNVNFVDFPVKLSSGIVKRVDSFPSKFVRPRTVDVWLPKNYSAQQKYAVLYMHDGQMLFDSTSTWNKQEWKVDEIVSDLLQKEKIKNTIVVAIWNHSDIRHSDYYPQKPFESLTKKFKDSIASASKKQYGSEFKSPNSDNYLKFIVEEVKPVIDAKFSVATNLENTVIAGSSMGGLISMYALCEYPEVFGSAACLSTHWIGVTPIENNPIPASFFTYLEQNLPSSNNHKIYFDYGTETLDQYYLPFQKGVDEALKKSGYSEINSKNLKFEGHDHSETSWNKRLQIPIEFLLKK